MYSGANLGIMRHILPGKHVNFLQEVHIIAIMRYDEMSEKMREWNRRTILQEYEEAVDHPEYRHFLKENFTYIQ